MNLMMLLEMASGGFGDRIAVGSTADGMTYAELFRRAGVAATHVRGSGAERLGLIDTASPALPTALFAAAWAGVPFVPLNYRLADDEVRSLVRQITPTLAICGDDQRPDIGAVEGATAIGRSRFLDLASTGDPPDNDWGFDGDDVAILLFTSGTTGAPKAAVLRHRHLVSYIIGSVEFMGAGQDEATLVSVPPYHVAGMAAILSAVYTGRRIVQLPDFTPHRWVELARAEAVTHAMVVPTMLARIVEWLETEAPEGAGLPSLRVLSYGGGMMPQPVIERALELLPETDFVNAYGLTETSSTIAVLGPDDHRTALATEDPAVRARLSSVGRPLPTVEVQISAEDGSPVQPGEPGEIWVKGEQVSGEYLGTDPRRRADGWFPTNDGGWMDADGYLFVTGRIDDIIIRGGENISPGEIEDVLRRHPAVRDAAAFGVPDDEWGEIVAAVVVADESEAGVAELQDLVRSRLRSSRTPDIIEFRAELPYNETGKLLRRVLRRELDPE